MQLVSELFSSVGKQVLIWVARLVLGLGQMPAPWSTIMGTAHHHRSVSDTANRLPAGWPGCSFEHRNRIDPKVRPENEEVVKAGN
jgi:hypothetical protein